MRLAASAGIWLGLACGCAQADAVLSTPQTSVSAGSEIELTLTITNAADVPMDTELPAPMHVRAETDHALTTLNFTPETSGTVQIAPGGFAQVKLKGTLPADVTGTLTLVPTGIVSNSLLLNVGPAAATPAPIAANPPTGKAVVFDKPPPLAISTYEPVYIIAGGDGGLNAKFQISLRYRLFDNNGPLARRLQWVDDLYLAYSQTSLWDLQEASKPFKDSSYRPRLFYADYDLGRVLDGRLRLGVETGFGHESNGKDGEESRSFNMAYVRPVLTFGDPDGFRAYVAPLIHNYIAADENPDIEDYRGYVDWLLGVGSKGGLDLSATLRKGTHSTYGSAELNLRYPLAKLSGGDLTGWLMLQYFGGYGESLLDYNRKLDSQLRLGFALAQ